jgi:hypothetical protein
VDFGSEEAFDGSARTLYVDERTIRIRAYDVDSGALKGGHNRSLLALRRRKVSVELFVR